MKYCVIDIETDGKEYRSRFCDPMERKNKVVMIQLQYLRDIDECQKIIYRDGEDLRNISFGGLLRDVDLLVGQNFKFDLLYLWNNPSIKNFIKNGGMVWDTRTVDYLLNSCRKDLSYSLDEMGTRYGLGNKIHRISEMYKGDRKAKIAPMTTMEIIEKIGVEEYIEYAKQDVVLTERLFLHQMERVKSKGMSKLIMDYMRYYASIVETEYNGLFIDRDKLETDLQLFESDLNNIGTDITNKLNSENIWSPNITFSVTSNDHLSILLFGGSISHTTKVPKLDEYGSTEYIKTGVNKGQIKYRNAVISENIIGLQLPLNLTNPAKKEGFYETNMDVIKSCLERDKTGLLQRILDYKILNKKVTDLRKKLLSNINPYTGCVHSEFNTTSTVTSRLSSSSPGSQNLHPESLKYIKPRRDGWSIVEFDWKTLEVVMAAYMFNDSVLKNELRSGIDMHLNNAVLLTGKQKKDVTEKERKTAKFMTFGILYGESEYGLARDHNISKEQAKSFINKFYAKYRQIHSAHNRLVRLCQSYTVDSASTLKMPNGKEYLFTKYSNRGISEFNTRQIKNYPLQGGAGDLHAYCTGKLFFDYLLHNSDKCTIVNNVHDSIIFEVKNEHLNEVIEKIKSYMHGLAKKYTGIDLFKMDCKYGESWYDAKNM